MAKRTKIATECNPLNVLCNIMFLALICRIFSLLGAFVHALLSRAYLSVRQAFLYSGETYGSVPVWDMGPAGS